MAFSKSSKIYVAGHNGMVGSAIVRNLKSIGHNNLVLKSSKELDLRNSEEVTSFFNKERPEFVFLAAIINSCVQALTCVTVPGELSSWGKYIV